VSGRATTFVAVAAVLAAFALPAASGHASASGTGEAAIFYYPWYSNPARDGGWAHWYVQRADGSSVLSTRYYPLRGLYSSSSAAIVDAQMREIAVAGIHTVVVSWWGVGSPEDLRLPLVLAAATRRGLRVALHVEPYPGRTPMSTAADITLLEAAGITDFYVYDPDADPASEWATALTGLDGARVFAQTSLVGWARAAGFVGVYTYDVGGREAKTFARLCTQAHRAGLLCAPSVGPGFDARLATSDPHVRPRLDGRTYDDMWRAAMRAHVDLVTITSYNEWQEGTQIEPARARVGHRGYDGAWGTSGPSAQRAYLDDTARWTARFRGLPAQ
jgi:hypothetical protein